MSEANEPTDIFLWANQMDAIKNELDVELFVFNRNFTPYTTRYSSNVSAQLLPLFLYDYINQINLGAGTGLSVRDYELSEAEDNVVLRTELEKVGHAATLLSVIESERTSLPEFSDEEHDFKRIKGVVARFSYKSKPGKLFYSMKAVQQGNVLKGAASWEFRDGAFGAFTADVGLKMPADNQVLIVDSDIFIFNQRKFETLLSYDYKKQLLADQKVSEIEKAYKLSFPDGVDLQSLVRDRKKTVSKLQKLEVGEITQEKALDYADDMHLDLMTDDAGAIIIMDGHDLDTFVNLINEDYITSEITGKRYEIKSKKLLDEPDGEPPRG